MVARSRSRQAAHTVGTQAPVGGIPSGVARSRDIPSGAEGRRHAAGDKSPSAVHPSSAAPLQAVVRHLPWGTGEDPLRIALVQGIPLALTQHARSRALMQLGPRMHGTLNPNPAQQVVLHCRLTGGHRGGVGHRAQRRGAVPNHSELTSGWWRGDCGSSRRYETLRKCPWWRGHGAGAIAEMAMKLLRPPSARQQAPWVRVAQTRYEASFFACL